MRKKKSSLMVLGLVVSHCFNLAKWIETDENLEKEFKRCIWTRSSVGKYDENNYFDHFYTY